MSGLIVFREGGWIDEKYDFQMWNHLARVYQVEFSHDDLIIDWDAALVKGRTLVVLEETGEVELDDFTHPEDAVYVIGRSGLNNLIKMTNPEHSVVIRTPHKICLFGISAGSILLADRLRKS